MSTFTGVGPPARREPWSVDLGLDLGSIPSLSEAERTVGFNGTKVEDLNKVPVFGRPRVSVGQPGGLSAELGWVPPVEINAVTSNLFAAAVERPFFDGERWTLGLRAFGQVGDGEADLTCRGSRLAASRIARQPLRLQRALVRHLDPEQRRPGCHRGRRVGRGRGLPPHRWCDLQRPRVPGRRRHQRLPRPHPAARRRLDRLGRGRAGLWPIGSRTWVAGEAFYSPLWVVRPPETGRQNDGLFNLRVLLRFHLR